MSEKNAAKEGQCTRDPRCTKGKGHAGWCKTKSGGDAGLDQDSLFASLSSRERQPKRQSGAKASREDAMRELARKRESKREKNLDQAIRCYNETLRVDDSHEKSLLSIAKIHMARGEYEQTEKVLQSHAEALKGRSAHLG